MSFLCDWVTLQVPNSRANWVEPEQTSSLTEGRRWDKRHRQKSTAGSWLCWLEYVLQCVAVCCSVLQCVAVWLEYVIRTSMNTWIISSIITSRASDGCFEHSKREHHEPHKDSWDWQDWGLTLEALPLRGRGSAECPKRTRGEWDAGVENKNTQNTQINLNK